MSSEIGIGRRDLNSPNHWDENVPKDCFLHGKNLLIIPGDGTNDEYDANAICKVAENFLHNNGISDFDGHIYSLFYPNSFNCQTHRLNQKAELNLLDDRLYPVIKKHQDYYTKFFDTYMLPLISDDNGQKRLSTEEAGKRMRNLPIICHCHGGPVFFEFENLFQQNMERLSYSDDERNFIQKQMFVLDVASAMPYGQTKSTVLHIISQGDEGAVKNWRLGSLNSYTQNHKLKQSVNALLEVSPNENILVLSHLYDQERCTAQDVLHPSEHTSDSYLDIKKNDDLKDGLAEEILKEAHQASIKAISGQDNLTDIALLFQNSALITQLRKTGQTFLSSFQQFRAKLLDVELKMFAGVHAQDTELFKKLKLKELLFRRDFAQKSAFEYITQSGNAEFVEQMMKYLNSGNSPKGTIPERLMQNALNDNFRQKNFAVYNALLGQGYHNLPEQIRAENMAAEDIPQILPILKKCQLSNQSLYTLLPIYLKAAKIKDEQTRDETRTALFSMLTPKKLETKDAFLLYQKLSQNSEDNPEKLQKAYQQQISANVLSKNKFLELQAIEESRQTDGIMYSLLSSKAKEHLEEVCGKEKIKNLNTYASGMLRSGSLSEQKNYTPLYTRELDKQGKQKFIEQIEEFHRHNRLKSKSFADLLKELKQYIINQNPDMKQNQMVGKQSTQDNSGRE